MLRNHKKLRDYAASLANAESWGRIHWQLIKQTRRHGYVTGRVVICDKTCLSLRLYHSTLVLLLYTQALAHLLPASSNIYKNAETYAVVCDFIVIC